MMKILLVSPYHTGSHKAWAEGYSLNSSHEVTLLTLPGRFWKWRMHGGSVTLAREFLNNLEAVDLILATDMLDLTTFLALTRSRTGETPAVLYMHENQLTYPLPEDPSIGPMRRQKGERDLHYAFVNYASMMAADRLIFNSEFHRQDLVKALPRFLNQFPEHREVGTVREISDKATVMSVGIEYEQLHESGKQIRSSAPPLVIWNQRWEYDKNPDQFLRLLFQADEEGLSFRVALCGEVFERRPKGFNRAVSRLEKRLVHVGYADKEHYHKLLSEAEVTVSTAIHEFFGVSIIEAIACRTFPILPGALSYPEIIPSGFHRACLYTTYEELYSQFRWALRHRDRAADLAESLSTEMSRFEWAQIAAQYDEYFRRLTTDN
jgi:glycosyltransferase involved in cell wall biosynthesis